MQKLATAIWLLSILLCGEEPDGAEVIQPARAVTAAGLVVPVAGIRG